MTLRPRLRAFIRDESGATSIEYGLIAALITIGLVAAFSSFGQSSQQMYENLDAKWDAASGG